MTADKVRVSANISDHVMTWANNRLAIGITRFFMADLNDYVQQRAGLIAPDSPGRILRDLRKAGKLQYRVVSRSQSLYELVAA